MEGDEDELRAAEPSAAEQLAELQLLSRFERPMMPVALGRDVVTESDHEEDHDDNDDDEAIRIPKQDSASSFAALLAASRRLAGSRSSADASSAPAPPPPPVSPVHINVAQRVLPRNSMAVSDQSKTTTELPTLSEEDDDNEDRPETEAVDSERPPEQEEEQDEEEEDDDAFDEMLRNLTQDHNFLLLSVSELTVRRLGRARDALSRGFTTLDMATHLTTTEQMRWTRSIVAMSTLSLLIKHYDVERVRMAVTDALSRLDEPNTHESEHLAGFLTSSNIARVVLMARESLQRRRMESTPSQSPVDSNSNQTPGRVQASSSPSRVRSPYSSSSHTASSPHSVTSPRRVSILAREGTHVLMNEKIVAFEYRPHVDQLPMFKVRRDSARMVEDAAKRRQRALLYAQEVRKGY
ncbi:hypothetical protein Poli38472_002751 [Pythium oligandrum]|uniref:Uncharacterized protein n=1 Tax=Pythium oligandrum TaxID=41045 RepID=A0A8K1FHE2_PYTOL|nr:hypothetical protein Poli38472_002751 [Pythium oligandrum]|eukprot:TMW63810.1 hypothetical protein Poli38472_002751 [Pythium oligandrum]